MPVFRLRRDFIEFPPVTLSEPDGLLAVGGDLSVKRLLSAYRSGVFPWYDENAPICWWAPDPRMVFMPGGVHVSRSLLRALRSGRFRLTADAAFGRVVQCCAKTPREGQNGTWILPEMARAYERLFSEGHAHSIECWEGDTLAGGLYGVAIGGCFFGESMFHHRTDAGKAALAALSVHCEKWGYGLIDAQMPTPHLKRMGGLEISRMAYMKLLRDSLRKPGMPGPWTLDPGWLAGIHGTTMRLDGHST